MAIKIIYKKDNEELFWNLWNSYIVEHQSGPIYLRPNIEIHLILADECGYLIEDLSFIYTVNNQPMACVLLPLERLSETMQIGMEGGYAYAPLLETAVEKEVFVLINEIAHEHKVKKISFSIDPLDSRISYNYLQKYNYFDTSILSYVIDLTLGGDLLSFCRKGHRCDIKKILTNNQFQTFIIDNHNHDRRYHDEYKILHHKCSGKVTRSEKTFDLQYQKLLQGTALLVGLKYKNKAIAYSYFEYYGKKAVYASGVDDPEYNKLPLYHVLVYTAMLALRERGVERIDTLQPSSPSCQFDYHPDQKQLNIARFKRGFGGAFRPQFRGVKFFSDDARQAAINVFLNTKQIVQVN